jgi:hypothetical protein
LDLPESVPQNGHVAPASNELPTRENAPVAPPPTPGLDNPIWGGLVGPAANELPAQQASPVAPPPATGAENPVWGLFDVILIVGITFTSILISAFGVILGMLIARGAVNLSPADLSSNGVLLVSIQTLAYLFVVAFMVFIVRLKYDAPFFASISWNMPGAKRALAAVLGGVALALFSEVASVLLSRWIPKSLPIDALFRTRSSVYAMAIFGIVVAPLVEELFFRGFLYPVLARSIGMVPSVVLTAASFALLHQGQLARAWAPLLLLFIVGSVLTCVRAVTRSVATSLMIHVGYNTTLFTLLFIATDGFRHLNKL